jgi:hypothetical protein
MPYAEGDRVRIKPLDGIAGTVRRDCGGGRYAVMADSATREVAWHESELEPGPPLHTEFSSTADD